MSDRFSQALRLQHDPIWEAQHQHPFVRGLADGTLPPERFQVWLRQDYLFLVQYARLFALAAARAPELDTMRGMVDVAHGIIHSEMLLHRAYAIEFSIAPGDLGKGQLLPTTRAYSDHLLRTASLASFIELAAALLPCLWGHHEIAARLARQPEASSSPYSRWIDLYSSPVAADLARKGRDLLDRLATEVGAEPRAHADVAFAASSRYEWMFWQMCWQDETWPV